MREVCAVLFTFFLGWFDCCVSASAAEQSHEQEQHGMAATNDPSCHVPIQVTEAAELKLGGALYRGPEVEHHSGHAQSMPEMEGAHMTHDPQHDGSFFMAPNKMHHLEGVYSEGCGFQLFLYNAFTENIHVDRFQAFIHVFPSKDDELDIIRFLSPSHDSTVLMTEFGSAVSRPFEIELYVKFPESIEPQLFNILVPAAKTTTEVEGVRVFNLDILGKKVTGSEDTIQVTQDEVVTLRWTSDEPMTIHLHGYDIEQAIEPGVPVEMTVECFATGRFPITAHNTGGHSHGEGHDRGDGGEETVLTYLEVYPR